MIFSVASLWSYSSTPALPWEPSLSDEGMQLHSSENQAAPSFTLNIYVAMMMFNDFAPFLSRQQDTRDTCVNSWDTQTWVQSLPWLGTGRVRGNCWDCRSHVMFTILSPAPVPAADQMLSSSDAGSWQLTTHWTSEIVIKLNNIY